MIYLHNHFWGFVSEAKYFTDNKSVEQIIDNKAKTIIGLAFYDFYLDSMIEIIEIARSKSNQLIVYIKEPFDQNMLRLLDMFKHDKNIAFFGDAVLNVDFPNWTTAVSWFVSPRNYYQIDEWAKKLLLKIKPQTQQRKYQFDCLLGNRKPHRDLVQKYSAKSPQINKILFSYFKDNINQGLWNMNITGVNNTWESIKVENQYDIALSALIPYYIYNESHHSIVAETTAYNEFNHVTEKIAKPIMAERIFVVFCGQYYLKSLHKLGFKTFDSIIDESYDTEPDMKLRFEQAWEQVEFLCCQDPLEVRKKVKNILEHNQKHFLKQDWHDAVKKAIKAGA